LILAARIPIVDVQAKARLTGAVILVVLLVLLVPELLSGPGPKVAAVATRPSDEPPLRSYTVELGDTRHTLAPSTPGAAPPSGPAESEHSGAAATPQDSVEESAPATMPQQEPEKTPGQATIRQPPLKAPAAVANVVPPESAPPLAGWTVQLGSFASRANAARLVRDLKSKGYAAFLTESASGGHKLYRVRVGPAGNHAAAETLAAQLRAAGHPGSLTQRP
jgi:DedD protein